MLAPQFVGREYIWLLSTIISFWMLGCKNEIAVPVPEPGDKEGVIMPRVISEPVNDNPDDPAIWFNSDTPEQSLVIGSDKGGSLFVYDLDGKVVRTFSEGKRFNNVDVEYGFMLGGREMDIVVATDRDANELRVLKLPDMQPIDGGGLRVFERPMGVSMFRRPGDGVIFVIVSRKSGPSGSYLWQYRLEDDGTGKVRAIKVREFGLFSGNGEIEAIAVDDALGYIYYADELFGIRKYFADPEVTGANDELATFGRDGFQRDREGIAIYQINDGTGYILVSDQQADKFRIYTREGSPGNPHDHRLVKVVTLATRESDGSDLVNAVLNERFPAGLFVAMSDDKTFHYYSWPDIAGRDLKIVPGGGASPAFASR